MSSVTYVKGLPTPANELNALGFSEFEMFLVQLGVSRQTIFVVE